MNASGGSLRNERITAMQETLNKTFSDDPSYYFDVEVFNKEPLNCRIYDMASATKGDGRMRIMSEYDRPVLVGDLLHWQDEWWICTHQQNIHDMFWNGVIERCNHLLKWKDSDGKIIERHCRAEDATKYTLGVTEQDFNMLLPDTRRSVLIPFDEDTIKLLDGKRLLIDKKVPKPKAYEITNVDRVTKMYGNNGIIILTCGSSQSSPNDNVELMIADYYAPTSKYTLEILDLPSPFKIKIDEYYNLEFFATKDGSNVRETDIKFASSNSKVATIDSHAVIHGVGIGNCKITASIGDKTEIIELQVQTLPVDSEYFINLVDSDGDGRIYYGGEKQIDVKMFLGSIELSDFDFDCELEDTDCVAEIKTINNEVGNHSIIVRAYDNVLNIKKTFNIKAWNIEHDVNDYITIKVVP